MSLRIVVPILVIGIALPLAAPAGAVEVPISVVNHDPIGRVREPVTCGVPAPPGTGGSGWSLWDGGTELPLQTSALSGQTPWILLDFQVDLGSLASKTLVLRDSPSASSPTSPLAVFEDASQILVTSGSYRFEVRKDAFNLISSVWIDRNSNGQFESTEQAAAASGDNLTIVNATTGATFSGTRVPDRIQWEYNGPVRATLRVDGRYMSGSTEFIRYTTRLSFFAGQSHVRVEQILRNSLQSNERPVKIRSASLRVGSGTATQRAVRTAMDYYASVGGGGYRFELLPRTYAVEGIGNDVDVDTNGGWVLPDLIHESRTVTFDFQEGTSSTEVNRRTTAAQSPLFGLAPGSWYSDHGNLSNLRIGTLDDEKRAYQQWGWTWSPSQEPSQAHAPQYLVSWWPAIHDDSESDDLWQNLVQYIRTGSPGYWDRSRGWAWYHRNRYAYRTDGFSYAWDSDYECGPFAQYRVLRPLIPIPLTSVDQTYLSNVAGGKVDIKTFGADHIYGWGLLDYYHLTGDVDAREAAVDLGEVSARAFGWRQINPNIYSVTNYGIRDDARNLLLSCRLAEVAGDANARANADHIASMLLTSPEWDSRGAFLAPRPSTNLTKTVAPFEFSMLYQAMYAYYLLSGNTGIRDRLVRMADFGVNYGLHTAYQYTGYYIALDYPNPGNVWHANFDDGALSGFAPLNTEAWIDGFTIAYRLTGNQQYLDRAKYYWDRASKANYGQPLVRTAGPNAVGRFVNAVRAPGDSYFSQGGDLPYMSLFFHDAAAVGLPQDVTAPSPPIGVQAR